MRNFRGTALRFPDDTEGAICYTVGENRSHKGEMTAFGSMARVACAWALVLVVFPGEAATPSVAASANTCALDAGGAVYCWGSNRYGALGQGTPAAQTTPAAVQGLAPAVASM